MIDEKRLAEIEGRAAAATPGPWRYPCDHTARGRCEIENNPSVADNKVASILDGDEEMHPVMVVSEADHSDDGALPFADAVFIAAARQDVPDLVAEVRKLRALVRELRRTVKYAERTAGLWWETELDQFCSKLHGKAPSVRACVALCDQADHRGEIRSRIEGARSWLATGSYADAEACSRLVREDAKKLKPLEKMANYTLAAAAAPGDAFHMQPRPDVGGMVFQVARSAIQVRHGRGFDHGTSCMVLDWARDVIRTAAEGRAP